MTKAVAAAAAAAAAKLLMTVLWQALPVRVYLLASAPLTVNQTNNNTGMEMSFRAHTLLLDLVMLSGGPTVGDGMCTGRPAGPPGLKLYQILVMLAATTRMNSRESLLLDSVLYVAMMLTFMCFSLVCQVCEGLWRRHHASVRNCTNAVERLTSSFLALYRYCTCDSRVCQQSEIHALYATPWAAVSL